MSLKSIVSHIIPRKFYSQLSINFHQWQNERKARRLRKKPVIDVIFVVSNISMWKTENLYLKMLDHPRFNPVIRVVPMLGYDNEHIRKAEEYLRKKKYDFRTLDSETPLQDGFKTDIIFFIQPYWGVCNPLHEYYTNHDALQCYAAYGIHNSLAKAICNQPFHNTAWQYYFENQSCAEDTAKVMGNHGRNIYVTGVPAFDRFMKPRSEYHYAWKSQLSEVKKIIYAPHFSFREHHTLKYGTFLQNGEFILELAKKYKDKIQFVFKPHPRHKITLIEEWGEEKADAYYREWEELSNGQLELGDYTDLFMTSDAMIHDCSTFTNEYMLTGKPVLYLLADAPQEALHKEGLNRFTQEAFDLHHKAYTNKDIERFILSVIKGEDSMKQQRTEYFNKYLKPVQGHSACGNIIAPYSETNPSAFQINASN